MSRRYLSVVSAMAVTAGWLLLPAASSADPLDPPPPPAPTITVDSNHPPTSSSGLVNVTYQVANGSDLDRKSVNATVKWSPTAPFAGAPVPDHQAVGPTALGCTKPGPVTGCSTPWAVLKGKYVLNGTYQVQAHGRACTPPTPVFGRVSCTAADAATFVRVANLPVVPTNVAATAQTEPPAVSIGWDPNPEPDVYAYAVFRLQDKKLVGEVGHCEVAAAGANACPNPPSLLDTASGGGTFSYQVVAYRYGATYSAADALSATSASTKAVTVAGPPAPTTTTLAPGLPSTSAAAALGTAAGLGAAGAGAAATTFPSLAPSFSAPTTAPGPSTALPSVEPPSSDPAVVGAAKGTPAEFGSHHQSVGNWGAVAAALLLVVLAMGGLWMRSQVKRAGVLEPVEPGGA